MLRRALPLLVLLVLCAGSTGCKLVSLVATTTESSEGRSDDSASDESVNASDSDSDSDSDVEDDDDVESDGWDDEDDD